ncbi:polyadenylate-binding protein-interacting protein 1 isoform X1 [Euwallacea fornicatus]|uniref:polyadenylate-binding protein-interacting protein 1 isoform X1 n=1 Tax=Euwallacea fornicatus TaxID=995702 RepID=UPI0033903E7E
MEQKAQVLWDQSSSSSQRPMRLPKGAPATESTSPNLETPMPPEPNKTFVLRPDAPEFIPMFKPPAPSPDHLVQQFQAIHITVKNEGLQYVKHSTQGRLSKIRNSVHGSEHSGESSTGVSSVLPEVTVASSTSDDSPDMIRLKQIISSLMKYPGQFDNLLVVFMETIYPYFHNIITMSEIAKILVSQAINCPNFRYNGVRLCWYIEQRCPEFRAELHLRCQIELNENPNQQNVLLFIAELYTQLPHDSLYGAPLLDSMKKLLSNGGNDNVKCVCQALKLTGYSLEQNHKQVLDNIFVQLQESTNSLSDSMLSFINSVINLRESNWGRSATEGSNSDSSSEYDQDYEEMVNGILYEVDGQALSTEQQEFLAVHASDYDGDADDLYEEMDEEMEEAFEEFLKLAKGNS